MKPSFPIPVGEESSLPDLNEPRFDPLLPPDGRGLSARETGRRLARSRHSREWLEGIALWADWYAPEDKVNDNTAIIAAWFYPPLGNLPGFYDWMLSALLCNGVVRPFDGDTQQRALTEAVRGWRELAPDTLAVVREEQQRAIRR